ncbi:S8 family serine peptidase [Bacillus dakarensis]|uniref:S8 family serine peptidase n=1 Tax=Robertmurraya dakarensis TaxID=1926278 RepID=UPI00098251E0|nr:S8 family serine peptidase [Bacillus dakarensis]
MYRYCFMIFLLLCMPTYALAEETILIGNRVEVDPNAEYLSSLGMTIISSGSMKGIANDTRTIASIDPIHQNWFIEKTNVSMSWQYRPARPVVVAVIDSGISPVLEDPYILEGKNFLDEEIAPIDDHGHGTIVTSVITQVRNQLPIYVLPLKAGDKSGSLEVSNIIRAIDYCIKVDVDIINLSFSGPTPNTAEQLAIQKAADAGITVIAAAGNDGKSFYNYPASYEQVVSVGSINEQYKHSSFSNYNDFVDFTAPGERISVMNEKGEFMEVNGTSFAAAYASAAFAIAKTHQPFSKYLEENEVSAATLDLGIKGKDPYYGLGVFQIDPFLNRQRGVEMSTEKIVSKNKEWTISFNKAVSSIPKDSIMVFDETGRAHPTSIKRSFDQHKVTVSPTIPYDPGSTNWLYIYPTIEDETGQVLNSLHSIRFEVEASADLS